MEPDKVNHEEAAKSNKKVTGLSYLWPIASVFG
jgi:hypothetical protein